MNETRYFALLLALLSPLVAGAQPVTITIDAAQPRHEVLVPRKPQRPQRSQLCPGEHAQAQRRCGSSRCLFSIEICLHLLSQKT